MNKFNFNRFIDILKKEWSEYLRAYGISLIVWACIPVAIWITTLVFDTEVEAGTRALFIFIIMLLALMNVPSKVYGNVNLQREGVAYSMLPATAGEKFFSMMIYCSIVTPVLTFAGCLLMDFLMFLMPFGGFNDFIVLSTLNFGNGLLFLILFMLIFSAVFMFGNMIFKKRKAGKTVAWIFLIVFAMTILIRLVFGIWLSIAEITFEKFPIAPYLILAAIAFGFYFGTYRKIKIQKY